MCIREPHALKTMKEKIFSSDLIYIGGGNYPRLMNTWKILGLADLMLKALDAGIVVTGISAGAAEQK